MIRQVETSASRTELDALADLLVDSSPQEILAEAVHCFPRMTFATGQWSVDRLDGFLTAYEHYMADGPGRVSFLDNHDLNRFLFVAGADAASAVCSRRNETCLTSWIRRNASYLSRQNSGE